MVRNADGRRGGEVKKWKSYKIFREKRCQTSYLRSLSLRPNGLRRRGVLSIELLQTFKSRFSSAQLEIRFSGFRQIQARKMLDLMPERSKRKHLGDHAGRIEFHKDLPLAPKRYIGNFSNRFPKSKVLYDQTTMPQLQFPKKHGAIKKDQ
ncbi:uncharacterized protein LOC110030350 [Phalaenopsis equestris]|uniref:uncharacterized protein LOC110030350 n=1 Tax=Phalaenopsis equestris TaxID=78828 RepID=UPI0009E48BBC|nr:uncharacterized protein LOC110030350 [Phalaenopsis equestris]